MVREGLRNVAAGANPMELKRGIEKAVEAVSSQLLGMAKDVETKEQIAATASISAADATVGEAMTEAMRFDKGYISQYFMTDPERMEAVLDDPYILIANQKVSTVKDLLPLLEKVMQSGKPLL